MEGRRQKSGGKRSYALSEMRVECTRSCPGFGRAGGSGQDPQSAKAFAELRARGAVPGGAELGKQRGRGRAGCELHPGGAGAPPAPPGLSVAYTIQFLWALYTLKQHSSNRVCGLEAAAAPAVAPARLRPQSECSFSTLPLALSPRGVGVREGPRGPRVFVFRQNFEFSWSLVSVASSG